MQSSDGMAVVAAVLNSKPYVANCPTGEGGGGVGELAEGGGLAD